MVESRLSNLLPAYSRNLRLLHVIRSKSVVIIVVFRNLATVTGPLDAIIRCHCGRVFYDMNFLLLDLRGTCFLSFLKGNLYISKLQWALKIKIEDIVHGSKGYSQGAIQLKWKAKLLWNFLTLVQKSISIYFYRFLLFSTIFIDLVFNSLWVF